VFYSSYSAPLVISARGQATGPAPDPQCGRPPAPCMAHARETVRQIDIYGAITQTANSPEFVK